MFISILAPYATGKPLIGVNQMLIPDRAGVKMTLLDWLKFIIACLPRILTLIKSRPSVVDGRVSSVCVPVSL